MKRIIPSSLACTAILFVLLAASLPPGPAAATPNPNSAVVKERIFNDCPFTTLNVVNNYPSLISFNESGLGCFAFANLHNWTLSTDGVNGAAFDNNSDWSLSADLVISGSGGGEAGLRVSPWWSQDVDGRFNVRSTDGEIACFGGRLPFYSFTGAYGLHYVKGNPIHLEVTYKPHGLNASSPATIQYELTYQGTTYTSGALNFDQANPAEDPPHGLWGMLNDGRVGGYQQSFNTPGDLTTTFNTAFSNIQLVICPVEPEAEAAAIKTRVFNDCPFTTLTVVNNYPSEVSFEDVGLGCFAFANLHVWTFADDGNTELVLANDDDFSMAADMVITGRGEGGLRLSPWWSHDTDGLFNVRSTDGEIACFGGRLPFYSFTGAHGLHYAAGDPIHLGMTYRHNGLSAGSPATIEYVLGYLGNTYTSGPLSFDMANAGEDPPHGLWGMLNDARAGGHFKAFMTPGDITAAAKATFTNIEFHSGAPMEVDVTPNTLNMNANGKWITAYLEPSAPYSTGDIDLSCLRLNGMLGVDPDASSSIGDHDGDGIPDLMVKFARAAATDAAGVEDGVIEITGCLGGACFAGSDQVKLVPVHGPAGGSVVAARTVIPVSWTTPEGVSASSASIYSSVDDGANWDLVADGVANSGRYLWTVPSDLTSEARIAVVLDENVGVSGRFSIQSIVGVGEPRAAEFALRIPAPNPSRGLLSVSFSLPDGRAATLSLYDVAGRRIALRDVGGLGAGPHTVNLASRLPAGLYIVRLDRDGTSLTTRAAVVK